MNKQSLDLIIVIPVGPACNAAFIADTIDSIQCYIHSPHKVILSDDSQNALQSDEITSRFPDVLIIKTDVNYGKGLGLYRTLSQVYGYALDHFNFKALLRLDTDALVTGDSPELQILDYLRANPTVGLAGRHIKGLDSPDQFGNFWTNGGREIIVSIVNMFTRFYVRHPIVYWRFRKLIFRALGQGYELGELVFGGAYVFSRLGLEKLRENGFLPVKNFVGTELEEDHAFSVMIFAVGLKLGDLSSGDLPFGCAWKGLAASPETLWQAGKKIIHSTRFWKDMKEEDIRKYFRSKRQPA